MWTQGINVHPCRDTILICPWKQGTVLYSTAPAWGAQKAVDSTLRCWMCSLECCGRGETASHSHFSVFCTPAMASCSSLHSRKHHYFFTLQPCYWNCILASSNSLVIFYDIFPEMCSSSPKSVLNLEAESCNKDDPKYTPKIY